MIMTQEKPTTFREIVESMAKLQEAKEHDYKDTFNQTIDRHGYVAALTRMYDKYGRAENLLLNSDEKKINEESVEDTLIDLACYSIMLVIRLRKDKKIQVVK